MTLKNKMLGIGKVKYIENNIEKEEVLGSFKYKDVKETLNNFHKDYWEQSYEGDKCKSHITCDELDYLLNKHFGKIIEIQTLQNLPNN